MRCLAFARRLLSTVRNLDIRVSVKSDSYIFMAVLLLVVPLQWIGAWLLAVCVHELCHAVAVLLCGGKISQLTVSISGMKMETSPLTERKRIIAILGGPAGGFLLALAGRLLPRTALCSWALSVYNLLPLLPLDGGRALQILLGDKVDFRLIEVVFLMIISIAAAYCVLVLEWGVAPIGIVVILWLRNRKIPCKEGVCKVQ